MNDSKIRDEYRNKYHDFINKEIIPTANKTLFDNEKITLSVDNNAGGYFRRNIILVELKQQRSSRHEETRGVIYIDRVIKYTANKRYRSVCDDESDNLNSSYACTVEVSNQNSFFDFIAICIKSGYDLRNFATKEELFNHLKGLIDDKRYVNQSRAAFEPSKFPEMNVWQQSEYYDFVDSEFKKKLFRDEISVSISEEPKRKTVTLTELQYNWEDDPSVKHPYRFDSKKYNNNPYLAFILRCISKDYKAKRFMTGYINRGTIKVENLFTRKRLFEYLDGLISDQYYAQEYDITFIPTRTNPGVDNTLKEQYDNFIDNEFKYKTNDNVKVLSVDEDDALILSPLVPSFRWDNYNPKIAFISENRFSDYDKKYRMSREINCISDDDPNFRFILECLSHNKTEEVFSETFKIKEGLFQRLKGLIFNQQCKENYLNNFHISSTFLPPTSLTEQSSDSELPALPGSSNNAVSIPSPQIGNALFCFWLYKVILQPICNYIINKISGQDHANDQERKKKSNDKPPSCVTGASASSSQSLDKAL